VERNLAITSNDHNCAIISLLGNVVFDDSGKALKSRGNESQFAAIHGNLLFFSQPLTRVAGPFMRVTSLPPRTKRNSPSTRKTRKVGIFRV
jgi:hypothetical protein